MGQCVSCKVGAAIASGHRDSLTYRIMDKPGKNVAKRGVSHTRGTAMSFGFRRRPSSGIPMPTGSCLADSNLPQPRSKSAGPEQNRRRDGYIHGNHDNRDNRHDDDDDDNDDDDENDKEEEEKEDEDNDDTIDAIRNSCSGRSTPRLAPPKKESCGNGVVRTNRFGYRQPQAKFTNKVADICGSHYASHRNQEKVRQQQQQQQQQQPRQRVGMIAANAVPAQKGKPLSGHSATPHNNNVAYTDGNRKTSGIPEPVGRYILRTSHLLLPQHAVRMTDVNSKIAKTATNQNRKVSATSKSSSSSKEGSSTEDSGVGSQRGCLGNDESASIDHADGSRGRTGLATERPRNLRMIVNGKSFDVRDVKDDDSTVTEISVIPLPKKFVAPNVGLIRAMAAQYRKIARKDNRYAESTTPISTTSMSTTSVSTTSSDGNDEGLGEEKVYKDRSRSEKVPSVKSDFSPLSSDDPEYGHGEAMADEYSSDEQERVHAAPTTAFSGCGTILPKNALRSVLLTIEDPVFAAAAASSTALIDDETSPVDSLFDSLTSSITHSDARTPKKENATEQSGNPVDEDSPGTPTNASNSLSLSEGREFFDDEIADQPGLMFDDNSRTGAETQSIATSQIVTENSHTLVEPSLKANKGNEKHATSNSPRHGKRMSRAGSVDTLSPCESIAPDDLILDYELSDAGSCEEQRRRLGNTSTALRKTDNAAILSELEAQSVEGMRRQWTALLGTCDTVRQSSDTNTMNNNVNGGLVDNNNQTANEVSALIKRTKQLQSPDEDSAGGDYYQLTYPN